MSLISRVFEHTLAYRIIQAPFAEAKLVPVLENNDIGRIRRVLDVGCGPGTNTPHFAHAEYLGVDINEKYIDYARRKYHRDFIVADVTKYRAPPNVRFDCVLLNSFLHHVNDADARRILEHLRTVVSDDGFIHILDLVLPAQLSPAYLMATLDRGDHPRRLEHWRQLFGSIFEPIVFEPYPLTFRNVSLWDMVYFKGRVRR